jgi:hypothetical protein
LFADQIADMLRHSQTKENVTMQVRATISPSELQEAVRMSRPKYFWLRFLGANWYATTICLLIVGVAINALVNHEHANWKSMALFFTICASLIGWSWYRSNTAVSAAAKTLSARSGTVSLEADGIRTTLLSGASTFVPWSSFSTWKEGESVFLINGKDGIAILPIDDGFRETMRGILTSQVN